MLDAKRNIIKTAQICEANDSYKYMHRIKDTLSEVRNRINKSADACGRSPESITLLAVSKKKSAEIVREAALCGQHHFGENYLQEALDKQLSLNDLDLCWHFIGPIQSNKTRAIAENFDWVHSVDRLKIAQRLNEQRPADKPPLNICLQINIDNEETKSGAKQEEAAELVRELIKLKNICMRGLMVIPRSGVSKKQTQESFKRARELKAKLNETFGLSLDTLSMGMSSDLDAAIAEGATIVRIGTALFGARQ